MILLATLLGLITRWKLVVYGDNRVLQKFVEEREVSHTILMRSVTFFFDPVTAVFVSIVAAALVWYFLHSWRPVSLVIGSVTLSALITHVLKHAFLRDRPEELFHLVSETSFSFPSGHTTAACSLAAALAIVISGQQRLRLYQLITWIVAASLAVAVAASRLYLGVHWFSDVTAGALIGVGTALLLTPICGVRRFV